MESYDFLPMASSVGLAVYSAQRNIGIFHNRFINFSSYPTFQQISGNKLSEALRSINYNNWGGSTNIEATMELILNATKESSNAKEECPTHLLIISDMEFDRCTDYEPNFKHWKKQYQKNNLEMPKIVFWNVAGGTRGVHVTKNEDGVILVSGFSPAIFKGIFDIENYNPVNAMLEILKPYLNMI